MTSPDYPMPRRWSILLIGIALAAGLLVMIGPATPAKAHTLAADSSAFITRNGSYSVSINGSAYTYVLQGTGSTIPDDAWFECWPVHRHHWGVSWWWHSHPSNDGAAHVPNSSSVSWGWDSYTMPDTRGVKTRCEYDWLHGNWSTAPSESGTV